MTEQRKSILKSIGLHALIAIVLGLSIIVGDVAMPELSQPDVVIQATFIDAQKIHDQKQTELAKAQAKQREIERQRDAKRKADAEKARKQKETKERNRIRELERKAKQAAEEKKRQAEKQQAELERKQKAQQKQLAEQREQRNRDQRRAERGEVRDRQFQRLRQEHRDAVAAHQAVGGQHIGEAARGVRDLVERGARGTAILIDIDQRETAAAVGMTVAARGRHVEARRDIPAEIAAELVVGSGLLEHSARRFRPLSWPSFARRSCSGGL